MGAFCTLEKSKEKKMFKKITTLSMALLFPVMAMAYTPKKEALLVGIAKYQGGETLPGIGRDINQMKKLLESRGFKVKVLFNEQATLKNVVNSLNSYGKLSSKDTFLFYDSTHGTQVDDLNGDETDDGLDEAFVLYNAYNTDNIISDNSGLLIDDQMDRILSAIPAKKMMIVDACHSGTIYKSFSRNAKTKSVKVDAKFKFVNKEAVLGDISKPKNLVTFSAARDHEKSIATTSGSLFTEAIYDSWSDNPDINFKEMRVATTKHIKNICQNSREMVAHTPTLYSTNRSFINEEIDDFLQVNITINPKKYLVEEYLDTLMAGRAVDSLDLNSKDFYNRGENIILNINTLGKQGHLYILTSKESENEITVLYPNSFYKNQNEQWRGKFDFPNAKTPFAFQADNNTKGLERTVVYTILSQSIIPELEVSRSVGQRKFQSIFKDFNGQTNLKNAFKDIVIKRKKNQLSIAKKVFSVGI